VSYADLVTLMFAFFVTLYAASNVDSAKLGPIASSLQDAFAVPEEARARPIGAKPAVVSPVEVVPRESNLEELRARLARDLEEDVRLSRAEISRDGRGLVISLPEQATFAEGSADVTEAAQALIQRVAAPLVTMPNALRIEGHTDDTPIHTARFSSNWELSTARAGAVVALLIERVGIEPQRLSAAGYGQFHPRAVNDSAANRARNRRIDLVILDK